MTLSLLAMDNLHMGAIVAQEVSDEEKELHIFACSGVGVIVGNKKLGHQGLELLKQGGAISLVGDMLFSAASPREQLLLLNEKDTMAYTGVEAKEKSGHMQTPGAVTGVMEGKRREWYDLLAAWHTSFGSLEERMVFAIEATSKSNYDSLKLKIVPLHGEAWDEEVNIEIKYALDPVKDLKRVIQAKNWYSKIDFLKVLIEAGDEKAALAEIKSIEQDDPLVQKKLKPLLELLQEKKKL